MKTSIRQHHQTTGGGSICGGLDSSLFCSFQDVRTLRSAQGRRTRLSSRPRTTSASKAAVLNRDFRSSRSVSCPTAERFFSFRPRTIPSSASCQTARIATEASASELSRASATRRSSSSLRTVNTALNSAMTSRCFGQ